MYPYVAMNKGKKPLYFFNLFKTINNKIKIYCRKNNIKGKEKVHI